MKRKIITCFLAVALCFTLFAGCGGKENTAPVISGVQDNVSVEAGSVFDALKGVTASDKEDGNLTSEIVVESTPTLNFVNGKATPEVAGTYELTYSVTDSGKLTATAYSTLTVTKKAQSATEYLRFDFADKQAENRGWTGSVNAPAAGTAELKDGAYVFDITDPGEGSGNIKLNKTIALEAADYKVKVWARSNVKTYAHLIAIKSDAAEWDTFDGKYNLEIGTEVKAYELNFTSTGEGDEEHAELAFEMGKITEGDGTPQAYKVIVDKVEIYEITGSETENVLFSDDFTDNADSVTVAAGDGAEASASHDEGAAKITIASYPTSGGVWSIKAVVELSGVTVAKGEKYTYSMSMTAQNAQSGELLVESKEQADANRANFNGFSINAGETKTVTATFTADQTVADPVLRFQLGNAAQDVTQNVLTIDNVKFASLTGDKSTQKTVDRFIPYGKGSENEKNPNYLWDTFNGTDEDFESGVGTIWTANGSLFYRIDQGGKTDWHNKLFFGFNGNPLVLPADSYFTVKLKVRADKNISCGMFLNQLGEWAPRVSANLNITTEFQELEFATTDTLVMDMNFELLFQFGSETTAALGGVTVEIAELVIMQSLVTG